MWKYNGELGKTSQARDNFVAGIVLLLHLIRFAFFQRYVAVRCHHYPGQQEPQKQEQFTANSSRWNGILLSRPAIPSRSCFTQLALAPTPSSHPAQFSCLPCSLPGSSSCLVAVVVIVVPIQALYKVTFHISTTPTSRPPSFSSSSDFAMASLEMHDTVASPPPSPSKLATPHSP